MTHWSFDLLMGNFVDKWILKIKKTKKKTGFHFWLMVLEQITKTVNDVYAVSLFNSSDEWDRWRGLSV